MIEVFVYFRVKYPFLVPKLEQILVPYTFIYADILWKDRITEITGMI